MTANESDAMSDDHLAPAVKSDAEINRLVGEYRKRAAERPDEPVGPALDWLIANGLIEESPKGLRVTEDGMIFGARYLAAIGEIVIQ